MEYQLGDSGIPNLLFGFFLLMGLGVGFTIFGLVGRPFSRDRARLGRPFLGAFCGLIFGASFCLLGLQMVAGRVVAVTVGDQLTLQTVRGNKVVLPFDAIARVRISRDGSASYLLIDTNDGDFYRGGPCKIDVEMVQRAIYEKMKTTQ